MLVTKFSLVNTWAGFWSHGFQLLKCPGVSRKAGWDATSPLACSEILHFEASTYGTNNIGFWTETWPAVGPSPGPVLHWGLSIPPGCGAGVLAHQQRFRHWCGVQQEVGSSIWLPRDSKKLNGDSFLTSHILYLAWLLTRNYPQRHLPILLPTVTEAKMNSTADLPLDSSSVTSL